MKKNFLDPRTPSPSLRARWILDPRWYLMCLIGIVLLSGCGDSRYAAERALWFAERKIATIAQGASEEKPLDDAQFEEIIATYKEVVDQYPLETLSANVQFKVAQIYVARNRIEDAEGELKSIVQNFSRKGEIASKAQFAIGKIYELQGDIQKALREYEKIADFYPLSRFGLEMPIYMAKLKQSKGIETDAKAYKGAVRHYEQIINDYADTSIEPVIQSYLARVYMESKEWEGALKVWDDMIVKYPNTPQAAKVSLSKAEVFATKMKDIPAAIEVYEDFLKTYSEVKFIKEVKLRLGSLYVVNGKTDKAREVFTLLLNEYPDDENLGLRSRLALVECLKKDESPQEEVVKGYDQIRNIYPDSDGSSSVLYLIYRYYKNSGETEKAALALDKAISEYEAQFATRQEKKEKLTFAQLLLLAYAEKETWDRSLDLLKSLSETYPDDPRYLLLTASLYHNKLKDNEKAVEAYTQVRDKFAQNEQLVELVNKQILILSVKD